MKTNKGNLKVKKKLPEELERYRLIYYNELEALLGCSRKTIWLDVKEGRFPAPRKYGRSRVAWSLGVVLDYMDSQPRVTYSRNVDMATDKKSKDMSDAGQDDI